MSTSTPLTSSPHTQPTKPTPYPSQTFNIQTPNLTITHWLPSNPEHIAFLVNLWNTALFISSIGGSPTGIDTPEKASKFLSTRLAEEFGRNGYGRYLVNLKSVSKGDGGDGDGEIEKTIPIGMVTLMRGPDGEGYTAPDIGFAIHPDFNGKGYATEAARALIEYVRGRPELGVSAVLGFCDIDNATSKRVMEKAGLKEVGVRHLKVFGGQESSCWVSLPEGEEAEEIDLKVFGIEDN